ncbi:hypothetical protein F5882DRAFT_483641 [Hyaloscypha sp. PMI_1271]|nr:hypothetical protein F5882DRAFT_483641 [Hyaloscypha sp. PMI_1271]
MHEREAGVHANKCNWLVNGNRDPGLGQKNQVQWKATDNARIHFENDKDRPIVSAAARISTQPCVTEAIARRRTSFPAVPNVPLTWLTGLSNAVDEVSLSPAWGFSCFFGERPRTGTYGKVPASVGHHLTSFATWGTWLLLPRLAKRSGNGDAGESHSAVVPRAFGHGYASIVTFAVNLRTTSLGASNNGFEILIQEEKLQLCSCEMQEIEPSRDEMG